MTSTVDYPYSPLELTDEQLTITSLRQQLDHFYQWSVEQFKANTDIEQLVLARSHYMDALLQRLWRYYQLPEHVTSLFKKNRIALIAVGGYGRQELHPLSDIDLLILSDRPFAPEQEKTIGEFIRLLWDLRLDVGHSVRTLKTCISEAKSDITIMTNLIESRLLAGSQSLIEALHKQVFSKKVWPSPLFYQAKVREQQERHKQYHSTSYNLEPDIKNSPGGLRDIQTIQWIAVRHFDGIAIEELKQFNYLTADEIEEMISCRRFLWNIRFALHTVISRYDNRLLFDRQLSIAKLLGYKGEGNRPVEKMMREYYRVVHNITELNQMLLQLFEESILAITPSNKPYDIDAYFQVRDNLIDIKDDQLFLKNPPMMMQLFHTIVQHPSIRGLYSNTIRQLRIARRKLPKLLSDYPEARAHFLAIIKHPDAIRKALLPMHQFSILYAYIPGWRHIVGMMQFDLFHAYTVDEHTIRLLLEIDGYYTEAGKQKHPTSSAVFQQLEKPELLTIAALYHDIAKGQAGDHSQLGAELVVKFCQLHEINEKDSELIAWLVRHHLFMSVTAQNRDIYDPAVIREFAQQVKNKKRLQYLLCLTVADVCATNQTLWNSWKQALMRELYLSTERSFDIGVHAIPQQRSIARKHKQSAKRLLLAHGFSEGQILSLWKSYRFDYFLRYSSEQIVWHARHLLAHDLRKPLVIINPQPFYGGTEIFIYSPDRAFLFAAVSNEIDSKNLNIHEAVIITNRENFALDTFIVLDPNGKTVSSDRFPSIIDGVLRALQQPTYQRTRVRRPSPALKHFDVPTQVNFLSTLSDRKTYLELIALDRPGLLACVGEVFAKLNLSLRSAKISTIGEHVQDLFVLTDKDNHALTDEICYQLREAIIVALESMDND